MYILDTVVLERIHSISQVSLGPALNVYISGHTYMIRCVTPRVKSGLLRLTDCGIPFPVLLAAVATTLNNIGAPVNDENG